MARQVLDRSMLNLSPRVEPIILRIEKSFGRSVVFVTANDMRHAEAYGMRDEDGTPTVGLTYAGCREITIVHELLHLECEAQGFPRTKSAGGTAKLPPEIVSNLIGEWFSIIEHQVIYPRMEMLGYDPSGDLDEKIRNSLLMDLKDTRQFLYNNPNRDILFVDLVSKITRVLTEGRRPIRRLVTKMMSESFSKELELSFDLADKIRSVKNWTPQNVRVLAESCLQAIGIPSSGVYTYTNI